jgi:SulP family sulfate permease
MVTMDKLEGLSFCKGMPKEYLKLLLSAGHLMTFPAGTYLFHEGLHSGLVYLLSEGQAALEVSLPDVGPMRLQTVSPGELLGWSPLLGLGWMTASAVALTPCRVLAVDVDRVLALATGNPPFGMEFMRRLAITLAQRLNATRQQLLETQQYQGQAVS